MTTNFNKQQTCKQYTPNRLLAFMSVECTNMTNDVTVLQDVFNHIFMHIYLKCIKLAKQNVSLYSYLESDAYLVNNKNSKFQLCENRQTIITYLKHSKDVKT